MAISILVFSPTGRILRRITCGEDFADVQAQDGEDWMLGVANDTLEYIVFDSEGIPTITPRPTMAITLSKDTIEADAEDYCLIEGIPEGCVVRDSSGNSVIVDDGSLEFVTDKQGEHVLRFECFPYLDKEVTIHAT